MGKIIFSTNEIKDQLKIVELSKVLGIEITGNNKIRSFTNEDENPSVQINTKEGKFKNTFKDFSSGNFGDVFKFYMHYIEKKEGRQISFLDAKKELSEIIYKLKTNIQLQLNNSISKIKEQELKDSHNNILDVQHTKDQKFSNKIKLLHKKNSEIYQYLLEQCDLAIKNLESRKYLTGENRKLTLKQLMQFNLHYISSPQKVKNSLTSKFSTKELERSGLFKNGNFIFNQKLIIIPFYEEGKITYLRARSIVGKKYLSLYNIEGLPYDNQRMFNSDIINTLDDNSTLYTTESEFDGMILNKMGKNFVSLSGLGTIPFERLKELNKRFRLRFVFDNDQPGIDALKKVSKTFGLPIKYLQIKDYKDLSALPVESQKTIKNNPLLSVKEMIPLVHEQIERFDGSENLISGNQIGDYNLDNIEWIVNGYLRNGIMEIAGLPKVGKSRLMLYIANCIATGKKLFNKFEMAQSKVLYVSYEEQFDLFFERLKNINNGKEITDNILFPKIWNLDKEGNKFPISYFKSLDKGGIEDLRKLFEKDKEIKVVIIDTYEKAFSGEDSNSNEYRMTNNRLKPIIELVAEFKRLIIFVHHNNKQISNSIVRKSLGTVALTGASDIIWSLDSYADDIESPKRILTISGRAMGSRKIILTFDDAGNWTEVNEGQLDIIERLTPEQKVVFDVFQKEPDRIFQFSEIAKSTNQSKQNATKKLKALVREKLIVKLKTGKYRIQQTQSNK